MRPILQSQYIFPNATSPPFDVVEHTHEQNLSFRRVPSRLRTLIVLHLYVFSALDFASQSSLLRAKVVAVAAPLPLFLSSRSAAISPSPYVSSSSGEDDMAWTFLLCGPKLTAKEPLQPERMREHAYAGLHSETLTSLPLLFFLKSCWRPIPRRPCHSTRTTNGATSSKSDQRQVQSSPSGHEEMSPWTAKVRDALWVRLAQFASLPVAREICLSWKVLCRVLPGVAVCPVASVVEEMWSFTCLQTCFDFSRWNTRKWKL